MGYRYQYRDRKAQFDGGVAGRLRAASLHSDDNFALLREFHCIAGEVDQYLPKPDNICCDSLRRRGGNAIDNFQAFAMRSESEGLGSLRDQFR